jgi:glycosyltransferase involved in cell wall biosynthesis
LITENELRQKMGSAARERALELFSSEKIAHELLALYEK